MIPGLTDVYEFGDWLKKNYIAAHERKLPALLVTPERGGLISVSEKPTGGKDAGDTQH
jgi:hypothetical protein